MKILSVLFFLLILPGFLFAQGQFGSIAKFGVAVGFSPLWVMPNVDPVNQQIADFGVDPLPTSGMFTWGGGGYAYVLFIENLRIGGMGFGGTISQSNNSGGINRQVAFSTSGGAFTVEYTFPFVKFVDLSAGLMIGGGSQEIKVHRNNGSFSWNSVWQDASSNDPGSGSVSDVLNNSYWLVAPTINFDFPLNRFIMFRLGGGYIFSVGDEWTIANEQKLEGVPSDLNGNSFFIQSGVYFGFFAF